MLSALHFNQDNQCIIR